MAICPFCREPIRESDTVAYPLVRGWEVSRKGGGANRILGRKRNPNITAHVECVEERLRRLAEHAE